MRKPVFLHMQTQSRRSAAHLLRSGADQHFCGFAAWCVSDLVRNPEDRFSFEAAHMVSTPKPR